MRTPEQGLLELRPASKDSLPTDIHIKVNIVWANFYGFQAKNATKQEAQWSIIRAVLARWQRQAGHVTLGRDFNASLPSQRPRSLMH